MMKIAKRYSTAILKSFGSGVVPNIGLEYIAVGRSAEVNAILSDLSDIAEGGGAFRFIVGRYGSGKSFLLQLARNNALERNYLVAHADLTPECRLTGTKGQGLKLYRKLIANLSTKARPEGNAIESFLQRWIQDAQRHVEASGISIDHPQFNQAVEKDILNTCVSMQEYVFGFDFGRVLQVYWQGYRTENDILKQSAIRWLRGEYEKKSEARLLGVSQIIGDQNWYDAIKLLALLSKKIGYKGLLVLIDESVNLYKITNRQSRENNYEKILAMFNDVMQGQAQYLGIYFGGTPQSIEDEKRGLYSYEALKSRLQSSRFVNKGYIDFSGPIIRLTTLSNEEIYVLLEHLHDVFCAHYKIETILTQDQIMDFMQIVASRIGSDKLLTPREVTRDFISLMSILQQNPGETYERVMKEGKVKLESASSDPDALDDNSFAEFDL